MSQQAKLSLSTKDVIHIEGFQENASLFKNESTLRIRTILQQLQTACTASGMGLAEVNALMEQGIPCEVLQPGANDWQMGCIRLSLEFQPGPAVSTASMASTVTVQSNAVVSVAPVAVPVAASVAAAATPMDFSDDEMASDLEADLGLESEVSLDSGLMDDLDDTFGDDLDMGGLEGGLESDFDEMALKDDELSEMMPDASESIDSDLDLSGLSDMDGFSDALGEDIGSDDLSLDLDSQAVDADDLGDLNDLTSPWDLSDDLDEMLLTNGSL
jgi:KGK domain